MSCFEFSPHHGKQQCLWSAQWALGSQEAWLISHTCSRITHTEDKSFPNALSITSAHIPDYANTPGVIYKSFTSNYGELSHTHACTQHTHMHTRACIHAHAHTNAHTHAHTHAHAHTQTHTHMHTHADTHTQSHTYTHTLVVTVCTC